MGKQLEARWEKQLVQRKQRTMLFSLILCKVRRRMEVVRMDDACKGSAWGGMVLSVRCGADSESNQIGASWEEVCLVCSSYGPSRIV